ncbi:MAG: class I SAM-dependent methyltransferase [Candidatus Woesearchaeota archaeon]|jgi:ubiquinone/menaquinone biosynthesis C-methylase UbiE
MAEMINIGMINFSETMHKLNPYIKDSNFILDYGCGTGDKTRIIKSFCTIKENAIIIGYDVNPNNISFAKKKTEERKRNNIIYVSSIKELHTLMENYNIKNFDTILSTFVLHEAGDKIFNEIYPLLNDNGYLCIMDHDKKEIDKSIFIEYLTEADKEEIKAHNFNYVFKEHTKFGLDDCVYFAEKLGFKTEETFSKDYFFTWIGKKK